MNSKTLVPHTERGTGSKIRFGVLIKGLLRQGLPIGSWRRSDVNCKLLCANVAPWLAFCYYGHEVSCSCREPFKAETTAHRSGGFIMLPHSRCGQTLLLTRFWILETDVKIFNFSLMWTSSWLSDICQYQDLYGSFPAFLLFREMLQGRGKHYCWGIMFE